MKLWDCEDQIWTDDKLVELDSYVWEIESSDLNWLIPDIAGFPEYIYQ